jgi:hypothetical protein
MKNLDFIKVGSSKSVDITTYADIACVGLVLSSGDLLLKAFKEQQIASVAILEISLGADSCKALLDLLNYLYETLCRPAHIAVEYSAGVTSVDDFFNALKEATKLDYTIDGSSEGYVFLNYNEGY